LTTLRNQALVSYPQKAWSFILLGYQSALACPSSLLNSKGMPILICAVNAGRASKDI